MARVPKVVGLLVAAVVALTGCSFKGAYSLPLPGGSGGGSNYHVTAVFDDVQDLVPMSAVRVNDVAVGDVTSIEPQVNPDGSVKAVVKMRVKKSVHLPANAVATLEQTTLLGEKYIALAAPASQPAVGALHDGSIISDLATSNLPDVEEVFGVLSNVLNGGSLEKIQTINIEISKALGGRETAVRSALAQLDTFVSSLDAQKQQIVRALDELNRFSGALAKQTGTIASALDNIGPGLKVLADERAQFTAMLSDLAKLGDVSTRIITASRQATVADLRDLQPILAHLNAAGSNLPHALETLITFPFPRNVDHAIPGDYNGLKISFDADPIFCMLVPLPVSTCSSVAMSSGSTAKQPTQKSGGTTTTPQLPQVPQLPQLPQLPSLGQLLSPPSPQPQPSPSTTNGGLLGGLLGGGR